MQVAYKSRMAITEMNHDGDRDEQSRAGRGQAGEEAEMKGTIE
jgi:hypothetical protein